MIGIGVAFAVPLIAFFVLLFWPRKQ